MTIQILFFGATAEIAGTRTMEMQIRQESTVEDALKNVLRQFPGMASNKLFVSVNQTYAVGHEMVRDGDELAIFTAVSGG
jgi:molybdopterin converting factor small subunit